MRPVTKKFVRTPYDELTYQIVGCAMAVHRALGPGCREDTYQRDLEAYFSQQSISYQAQRLFEVYDSAREDVLIGYYVPDFVVGETIIVEIKALQGLSNAHVAQLIGYLAVSGCALGLLINFGRRSLEWRRIFPPQDVQSHKVNRQWLFVPDWLKNVE